MDVARSYLPRTMNLYRYLLHVKERRKQRKLWRPHSGSTALIFSHRETSSQPDILWNHPLILGQDSEFHLEEREVDKLSTDAALHEVPSLQLRQDAGDAHTGDLPPNHVAQLADLPPELDPQEQKKYLADGDGDGDVWLSLVATVAEQPTRSLRNCWEELAEIKAKMTNLTEKLVTAEELVIILQSNHEIEVQIWTAKLAKSVKEEDRLRTLAMKLQEEVKGHGTMLSTLNGQVQSLRCENEGLTRELMRTEADREVAERNKPRQLKDCWILITERTLLQELRQEVAVGQSKIVELTGENGILKASVEQYKSELRHLQDKLQNSDVELAAIRATCAAEMACYERDLSNCTDVLLRCRDKNAEDSAGLADDFRVLQDELVQIKIHHAETVCKLNSENAELRQANSAGTCHIRKLRTELVKYRQLLDTAEERQRNATANFTVGWNIPLIGNIESRE